MRGWLRKRVRIRRFGAFLREEAGASAIVVALAFPVFVGGLAMGAEAGYWLLVQRQMQQTADLAAYSAAVAKRAGADEDAITESALQSAEGSGFEAATDTLTLFDPPAIGENAGEPNHVEVRISRDQQRFFTLIYDEAPFPISARAVASLAASGTACLLALSPDASGAITVAGSTDVTFDGCEVASNSTADDSFLMQGGGSSMTTDCINTAGGAVTRAGLTLSECGGVRENQAPLADPYGGVVEPALTGPCENGKVGKKKKTTTLSPDVSHPSGVASMRFCSGLTVKGDVVFEPGLYIIEGGDFRLNSNIQATGDGVTFFLGEGVRMKFNGNADFNFTAPTGGPFSGLVFFGSRDADAVTHKMNGTADSTIDGAIYTPASALDFLGNFTWDGTACTQMVASTVRFTGNSTLLVDCKAPGTEDIEILGLVRLVE